MNTQPPASQFNNILSKQFCLSSYNWPFHTSICFIWSGECSTIKHSKQSCRKCFLNEIYWQGEHCMWVNAEFLTQTLVKSIALLWDHLIINTFFYSYIARLKKSALLFLLHYFPIPTTPLKKKSKLTGK
jgi:hypothetical protein